MILSWAFLEQDKTQLFRLLRTSNPGLMHSGRILKCWTSLEVVKIIKHASLSSFKIKFNPKVSGATLIPLLSLDRKY